MNFRPARYPCSNPDAHLAHEHDDGPDNYHYLCAGREKRWTEMTADEQVPPWGLLVDQARLREQLDEHDAAAEQ